MIIWILLSFVSILAVALAFAGVWFAKRSEKLSEKQHAIQMYEARISEIDTEFSLGRIDEGAREAAKAEQARNLIGQTERSKESGTVSRSVAFSLIAISMILVPVGSGFLYFQLGTPNFMAPKVAAPENASLEELVAAAEKRLAEDPDDARGWRVLAPVYMRNQKFEKAAIAYRNLLRLVGKNPVFMAGLGEALFMHNQRQVTDETFEIFKELSALQPENSQASFFVALGELQRGNKKAAKGIWLAMLEKSNGNEPWLPVVKKQIAELGRVDNKLEGLSVEQLEQVNQMVSGLSARLEEDPDDKPGWERLVRSYLVLNENDLAVRTVNKAQALFPSDKEFLSRLEKMIEDADNSELKP